MSDEARIINYLNTDLDLISEQDLTPLCQALDARDVYPLNVEQGDDGLWYSILEVSADVDPAEAETTIRLMLDAIESLDPDSQAVWNACGTREFNIGYDCGDEPWAFNNGLSNDTLQRMAAAGASLRVTLYPHTASPSESDEASS